MVCLRALLHGEPLNFSPYDQIESGNDETAYDN
jgi:hypothetical protein